VKQKLFVGRLFLTLLIIFILHIPTFAGISVNPKRLFFDASKRSIPLQITNTGTIENEVWIEIKYGYVTSDDTGREYVVIDSTAAPGEPSAAEWIKPYPERFILPAGETQTVRFVSYPPPGITDGEYWARIIVTGKPRGQTESASKEPTRRKSSVVFYTSIGIPLFYRHGNRLSAGIDVSSFNIEQTQQEIIIDISVLKKGNAAYDGTRTIRMFDSGGKIIKSNKKDIIIYKNSTIREKLDRSGIISGKYKIEVEFTGKKVDSKSNIVIEPTKYSTTVDIR